MATCTQTLTGIGLSCEPSIGGVKRAWIATQQDVINAVTVEQDKINNIGTAAKWKSYELTKGTAHADGAFSEDSTGRVSFFQYTIEMVFPKITTELRKEIMEFAKAPMCIIMEDNNGTYWFYGKDTGCTLGSGSTVMTGTAVADMNGATIQFMDEQVQLAYEVNPTAMESILNPSSPEEDNER